MASIALNAVVCGFFVSRHAPPLLQRAPAISMGGVSDRMANDGLLYEGWGKEGMEMLNTTATLQQLAEDKDISRYDAVLLVSARAKELAYKASEEEGSYLGSSFGGPMGVGSRKPLPAKSQVVTAIEELLDEVQTTGELPELVPPGTPEDELLEEGDEQGADEEGGATAEAVPGAAASAEGVPGGGEEAAGDVDELLAGLLVRAAPIAPRDPLGAALWRGQRPARTLPVESRPCGA